MKSTEFDKQKNKKLNNPRYATKNAKSVGKSKHKHLYIEVLLLLLRQNPIYSNQVEEKAYRTRVCAYCGKIQGLDLMEEIRKNNGHFYTSLSREEMLERYPNHLVFDLGDHVYKKYYDLDRQGNVNIRTMYKNQIERLLPGDYEISEENISYGLINNVKPNDMATLVMRQKECVANIDNKGDNNNA